jgi:ligand-binding sensor domain-containing protein
MEFFNTQIQSIHQDAQGTLWASSYGNGVFYYNPITNKKGRIQYVAGNKNGLLDNYVNSLFRVKMAIFGFVPNMDFRDTTQF